MRSEGKYGGMAERPMPAETPAEGDCGRNIAPPLKSQQQELLGTKRGVAFYKSPHTGHSD